MAIPTIVTDDGPVDIGMEGGSLWPNSAKTTGKCFPGGVAHDRQDDKMPGVAGTFSLDHGASSRTLTWQGTIRTVDQATMNTVLDRLDALKGEKPFTVTDSFGRTYEECKLQDYAPTREPATSPDWLLYFYRMTITCLNP